MIRYPCLEKNNKENQGWGKLSTNGINAATEEEWDAANKAIRGKRKAGIYSEMERVNERRVKDAICFDEIPEVQEDLLSQLNASDTQVGGDHYTQGSIQPLEYTLANNLGFCEGNVIKYITRYKHKNGIEDLEKAKHYIELLIDDIKRREE